jgi:undecaprenyl diphosphate synthase
MGEKMTELNIPYHVGLIMDGNRRWAKERNKKSIDGHLAGAERIVDLAKYIFKRGISYLSIYAFSTENFKRSEEEVSYLMGLIIKYFNEKIDELAKENIKIIFSGRKEPLSKDVWHAITEVERITNDNDGGTLNVCLNYGGRTELVDAANKIREAGVEVTEETFSEYLYQNLPDLDFIIRTSGERRLSNFMIWQNSYAELYFPKVYFPDFDESEFEKALEEYNSRIRRYGGS